MTQKVKTAEADNIRTVYLTGDDKDALSGMADVQRTSTSALVRQIFEDFVNGKLKVSPEKPRKTTVWIDEDLWLNVRAFAADQKVSVGAVLHAGVQRLQGGRR